MPKCTTGLCIENNPIKDAPEFIVNKYNCIEQLRIWWKATENKKKVKPNKVVKLQLIVNGNAGKSSTIEALKKDQCKKDFNSTHGIVIEPLTFKHKNKKVRFQAWDFGGQEIYHGTHKLFIASESIQLIVAADDSEQLAKQRNRVADRDNPEDKVLHQPLQHYINTCIRKSPKSQRLIIQNKIDVDGKKSDSIKQSATDNQIPLHAISATTGEGIAELKDLLALTREKILHYGMSMPISWLKMQRYFIDNMQADDTDRRHIISIDFYDKKCKQFKVWKESRGALLQFLHSTGIIYYNKQYLKDKIIADQKWALNAIYAPLDRKSRFYKTLRQGIRGRVLIKELFDAFGNDYNKDQKWLFLHFMYSCGLCFPLNDDDYSSHAQQNEDSYCIFPEYLPDHVPPAVEQVWQNVRDIQQFKYQPEYLDYFSLQKFIVELGHKTHLHHIWRNGIVVATEKGLFRVEADNKYSQIIVHIEKPMIDDYLSFIIDSFSNQIQKNSQHWYNADGTLLDIKTIKQKQAHTQHNRERGINNQLDDHDKKNIADQLPDIKQRKPKRLVVSFASQNLDDLKSLRQSLAKYDHNGSLLLQYDDLVTMGRDNWNNDIERMFQQADGYLILLSTSYQDKGDHPYIWNKEIPIITQRLEQENIFTYCLMVTPVNIVDDLTTFTTFQGGKTCLPESGHQRDQYLIDFATQVIEKKFLLNEEGQ